MAEYSTETDPEAIAALGSWNGWSAPKWVAAFVVSLGLVSLLGIEGRSSSDRTLVGTSSVVQVILLTLLAHRVASLFDKTTSLSTLNKVVRLMLICGGLFASTMFSLFVRHGL